MPKALRPSPPDGWQVVPCPLCGSDSSELWLEAREGDAKDAPQFRLESCPCGHVFTNPRPEDLAYLYPDAYHSQLSRPDSVTAPSPSTLNAVRDHLNYPPGPRGFWSQLRTWPRARRLKSRRPYLDALPWVGRGRLLDYGCGAGAFLLRPRALGWSVSGIELSQEAADRGQALGLEVTASQWPGQAFAGREFDVITAWHVLEHAPNPRQWVEHAAGFLAPGGLLILCCPVRDSWAARFFREDWVGLELPRHLSHFRRLELENLVVEAGLKLRPGAEQARSATLRASAQRRAARTDSTAWSFLARRRTLWSLIARLSARFRAADGAIVIGRRSDRSHLHPHP